MRRIEQLAQMLALATVVTFAYSERAAALPLQAITLPSADGILRVGNYFGMIFAVFEPESGNCTIWQLSSRPYMVADLWVTGTGGEDAMEVFDVPGEQSNLICGARATAVDRNGFAVMFEGHGGDDYMKNGDIMIGGDGKDTIGTEGYSLAETGLAHIEGGAHNDVLIAETRNGATLLGGGGNDNLCVIGGVRAAVANGNSGSNKLFGSATSRSNVTTITSLSECLDGQ